MPSGWIQLLNMRQPHFIAEDGRSLCGHWGAFETAMERATEEPDPDAHNCKACWAKWMKRRLAAKAAVAKGGS